MFGLPCPFEEDEHNASSSGKIYASPLFGSRMDRKMYD